MQEKVENSITPRVHKITIKLNTNSVLISGFGFCVLIFVFTRVKLICPATASIDTKNI